MTAEQIRDIQSDARQKLRQIAEDWMRNEPDGDVMVLVERVALAAIDAPPEPMYARCLCGHGWTFDFAAKRVYCRQCEPPDGSR